MEQTNEPIIKKERKKLRKQLYGAIMKTGLIIVNQLLNLTFGITTEEKQAIMLIALFAINL